MSTKSKTLWKLEPHTKTKHIILRKYLNAWIPILSRYHGIVNYIDGFAGPGEYEEGEEGSPIIAIKALTEHVLLSKFDGKFNFLFVEHEKDRYDYLKNKLKTVSLPKKPKINIKVECGEFHKIVGSLLDKLDKEESSLAPTFVFIDPFGFAGVPLELIKRIMNNKRCEVLINFMYDKMNRWLENKGNEPHLNMLFGTEDWKKINGKVTDPKQKIIEFHNLYQKQLTKIGIKYVRSFQMVNQFNKPEYFLFFGSNNIKGLEVMKEAMWKVDDMGDFQFSDYTYNIKQQQEGIQTVLFEKTPNYSILKKQIIEEFKGKTVDIAHIENFVISETAFLRKHIRMPVLDKLEYDDKPIIKVNYSGKKRRRGAYPSGCKIQF